MAHVPRRTNDPDMTEKKELSIVNHRNDRKIRKKNFDRTFMELKQLTLEFNRIREKS